MMHKRNSLSSAGLTCAVFLAAAISSPAQTLTGAQKEITVVNFDGTNGANSSATLLQGADGNLYGTTSAGALGYGTVFKLTQAGTLITLHEFCAESGCTDGSEPFAGVVQGTDGNLYGTTATGGSHFWGTVFKITPDGMLTTLYNFCGQANCTDGGSPDAGLIEGLDGNFYGTTAGGGTDDSCPSGCGTVFKISPDGVLTTLHDFELSDGAYPYSGLILGRDGNFYGATSFGGANFSCSDYGCGTVFKMTNTGSITTLYSFCSQNKCTDGSTPQAGAGLVQGNDGDFYGTTENGGAHNSGTIFKITAQGALTTLYSFCAETGCADGANPNATLIQASDGRLYGTTQMGGSTNTDSGTIFRMTTAGAFNSIYSFNLQDGESPGTLVQTTNGAFYGTTFFGGSSDDGTVFAFSPGLPPFVKTLPVGARVGVPVKILGTNLTGATAVTFNGTAAAFVVVSPSLIAATVPQGATSGSVQVVTPGGTLSSTVPFRVIQ